MNYEHCCECGERTGRAGAGDGSLYQGYTGPFCEDCFDAWPDKMVEENAYLKARIKAVSVPDICWDYDHHEDGVDPDELAVRLSDNLQTSDSKVFAVSCAKMLPNMGMRVSVSYAGDVTWEWDKLPEEDNE